MNSKMIVLACFATLWVVGGCKPGSNDSNASNPSVDGASNGSEGVSGEPSAQNQGGSAGQQGSDGGITPMGGVGAGPMTPVSGTESLQGGGSGVGQAAKDKAKEVAASSPSSISNAADDGGQ